jgi:CrcB protein
VPSRRALIAVLVGGALGTALRDLAVHIHVAGRFPWVTLVVNVTGAFVLGVVLPGLLDRAHPLTGRFVGTGVLAAFTTMSTFALETALLLRDGDAGIALGYSLATVGFGLGAAVAGAEVARRWVSA